MHVVRALARYAPGRSTVSSTNTKKRNQGPAPRLKKPRIPVLLLVRMFLVGSVAVAAACWGIWRYYFVPRTPLLVPAPSTTELPAPDLEPLPSGSGAPR